MAAKKGNVKVTVKNEVAVLDQWITQIKTRKTNTARSVSKILENNRASLQEAFESKSPGNIKSIADIVLHSDVYVHMPDANAIDFAIRTARDRYGKLAQELSASYSEFMAWHGALHRTDLTDDELLEFLVNLDCSYNKTIKAHYGICQKVAAEKVGVPFDIT